MKKRKLLFAAAMLLFSAGAWAQTWTDKTSVITNPSFETDEAISNLTSCGWATDRATGWTIAPNSPSNAQVGVGNSSSTIQGIATSFSPSDGDKYFYMRENWNPNTTFSVSQTIPEGSIPAGFYRLTVKAAMFSSVASTYTLSLQEEGQTAAANSFSYAGTTNSESWRDWSVMLFKRADNTRLTITASYKTPGENSGSKHYAILLDDVKLEYLAPTSVSSSNTFDMTSWIVNPSFELNTFNGTQAEGSTSAGSGQRKKPTGYTCYFNVSGWEDCAANTTAPAEGTYCINAWFGSITEMKFYQTIDYLPEGVYEISAQVRTNETSTDGIYTYGIAGGQVYPSDPWDASSMAETWNSMDNWQTLTARASVIGGGPLQFGLRSDKFVQFDDFHLTYLGSDLLLSELKSSFSAKQTTANGLLNNSDYENVVGTERTTLTTKKSVTPEETVAGWTTAVNELQNAIDAFIAAKTNYDANAAEVLKATALGVASATISTYTAGSSTTAETALTNTQNLKVAEYNYVTDNYAYGVALGEWTSTGTNTSAATFSNEHWSGTTHNYKNQNDNDGQGWNASSWSINFSQDVTLPAGNYVFKVAGRQASDEHVVTSLIVKNGDTTLGSINDFPRSNNARGINKNGETAFEGDNSEFANEGKGFGWEWRYVKFTLTEGATVNIAINAVATAIHCWVSFGDYTLQTDDDKNLSLIAYNIALASAQTTIADETYSNVTGSEKTALQNAIDADVDKTDKDDIDAATEALDNAKNAFTAAKSNYDTYVAAKAVDYPTLAYAATAKRTALDGAQDAANAISASDADTKTDAIQTAARQYYESHALAEGVTGAENKTSLISDPNFADVTISGTTAGAWTFDQTGGSVNINSNEPFTDGSGNSSHSYYDYYNNGSNNQNIHQVISNLAPGRYLLTATARAHTNFSGNLRLYVNGKGDTKVSCIGNSGGVFNRGWNDVSFVFDQLTEGDVTIGMKTDASKKEWWGVTRFRLVRLGDATESVTVTSAGYATFASDNALDFSSSSIKAYTATVESSTLNFTRINKVPAGTGVLLYADGGATEDIPFLDGEADETTGNVFVRGTGDAVTYDATHSYYVLANVGGVVGFYQANNNTVATNRAYINAGGSLVKSFYIDLEDDATGLNSLTPALSEGERAIYKQSSTIVNLAGQRMNKIQKGINIVNGKKILK